MKQTKAGPSVAKGFATTSNTLYHTAMKQTKAGPSVAKGFATISKILYHTAMKYVLEFQ